MQRGHFNGAFKAWELRAHKKAQGRFCLSGVLAELLEDFILLLNQDMLADAQMTPKPEGTGRG